MKLLKSYPHLSTRYEHHVHSVFKAKMEILKYKTNHFFLKSKLEINRIYMVI